MAEAVLGADEHLGHDHDHQRHRHGGAQADKARLQALPDQHVPEDAPAGGAHHARRHHALLARVDHAVGAVEDHDQQGAEGGDGYLVDVGHAENQQEQRNQRGRRRGAEEVDQELHTAVGPLIAAQQHAQRHADHRRDGEGLQRPRHGDGEVRQQLAAGQPGGQRHQRIGRARQQDRLDQAEADHEIPDGEQHQRADHRQQPVTQGPARGGVV
ncbi:hypothetical protein D3C87_1523320 [compost metagenome]